VFEYEYDRCRDHPPDTETSSAVIVAYSRSVFSAQESMKKVSLVPQATGSVLAVICCVSMAMEWAPTTPLRHTEQGW
jgi:hypothetical protein